MKKMIVAAAFAVVLSTAAFAQGTVKFADVVEKLNVHRVTTRTLYVKTLKG